jgi:hypothetical protein
VEVVGPQFAECAGDEQRVIDRRNEIIFRECRYHGHRIGGWRRNGIIGAIEGHAQEWQGSPANAVQFFESCMFHHVYGGKCSKLCQGSVKTALMKAAHIVVAPFKELYRGQS